MNYAKEVTSLADYGLTLAEATGLRYFSPTEKYGVAASKLLLSVSQNDDNTSVAKEIGQAGITVLYGIGGYLMGDKKAAAQVELFGKTALDFAAWLRR